jgi:hypothetical protein
MLLFDVCFRRMKPAVFLSLQQQEFVGIVAHDLPLLEVALDDSLVIIDIDNIHYCITPSFSQLFLV